MPQFNWQLKSIGTNYTTHLIAGNGMGTWVVVQTGGGVFRSEDDGETWASAGSVDTGLLTAVMLAWTGSDFLLAINPTSGAQRLYSSPTGATWTNLTTATTVSSGDMRRYARAGSYLYLFYGGELARTTDGTSFTQFTSLPGMGYATFVAASPTTVLTTQSNAGEVYRSTNAGDSWQLIASPPSGMTWADGIYWLDHIGAFLIVSDDLWLSYDDGDTWSVVAQTSLPTLSGIMNLRGVVSVPGGILANVTDADSGSNVGLWFSDDAGATWASEVTGTVLRGLQATQAKVVYGVSVSTANEYAFADTGAATVTSQEEEGGVVDFFTETIAGDTYQEVDASTVVLASEVESAATEDEIEVEFQLNNEIDAFGLHRVADTFNVTDLRVESRTLNVADALVLQDQMRQGGASHVESSVGLSVEQDSTGGQFVEDAVSLTDAQERKSIGRSELVEALHVSDAVSASGQTLVEDVVAIDAALLSAASHFIAVQFGVDDALEQASARAGDTVDDGFTLGNDLEAQVVSHAELTDTVAVVDEHFHKSPHAIAWVMNTETAAAYWYSNWQFSDMVQVGDVVLAVGPEGLCVIGGNTDAGEAIDAVLKYGFMDFGTEQKKRLPEIVFGYAADTPMAVEVETYGQGYPAFEYRISPQRQSQQPTNGRLTPGKALNARYWRIAVHNTDGGAFSVNSITATVAESARRL